MHNDENLFMDSELICEETKGNADDIIDQIQWIMYITKY